MVIRMDDVTIANELEPLSRLESLVQKARSQAAEGRTSQRPQPLPQPALNKELDFNDPNARENFLSSLQGGGLQQTGGETHHALDPERVAALLDLE